MHWVYAWTGNGMETPVNEMECIRMHQMKQKTWNSPYALENETSKHPSQWRQVSTGDVNMYTLWNMSVDVAKTGSWRITFGEVESTCKGTNELIVASIEANIRKNHECHRLLFIAQCRYLLHFTTICARYAQTALMAPIALPCQVWVYSSRGFSQVRMEMDEGRGQRAGQEVSLARVSDCLDSTTRMTCVDPLHRFWSWGWRQRQTETGVVTKLISDWGIQNKLQSTYTK